MGKLDDQGVVNSCERAREECYRIRSRGINLRKVGDGWRRSEEGNIGEKGGRAGG